MKLVLLTAALTIIATQLKTGNIWIGVAEILISIAFVLEFKKTFIK